MKITKYPDGTSYVEIENGIDDLHPIVFKINNYEDLHHLEQFVEAYNYKHKEKPWILIPNLIDAQADRRFAKNQSSGLKVVLKRLNSMNADFKIFHPHNPEVVEALMNNVEIIGNSDFIKDVLTSLDIYGDKDSGNTILMSSDAGGFKPLMKLCEIIEWADETYSATKGRKWDYVNEKSIITQLIDRNDFGGKDIIIVDDISVYGGTFKGLSKLLRERNCGKLYLAVSHMTIQNLGEDPVTNYFDKVFTTNSKFDDYVVWDKKDNGKQPKNLEIIKLF